MSLTAIVSRTSFTFPLVLALTFLLVFSATSEAASEFDFNDTQQKTFDANMTALKTIVGNNRLRNRISGKLAQHNLHQIYLDNPQYLSEERGSLNLTDGVIGPVTEKWMAYFAMEFNIDPSQDSIEYGQHLFESLVIAGQIQAVYAKWRDIIKSEPFKVWVSELEPKYQSCDGSWPGCYGSAANLHYLLDQYAVALLEKTVEAEYIEWLGVYYRLNSKDLNALVEAETLTKELQALLLPMADIDFAQLYLFDVALKEQGIQLDEEQRAALLKVMRRPGEMPPASIVKTREGVEKALYQQTAIWQATEDCGCAKKLQDTNGHASYFYSFYPYWRDAKDVVVNFEQLTRIGYFAATLDGQNDLHLPPTWNERFEGGWQDWWQNDEPYSDMVAMAHKYRVKVDLVVANQRPKTAMNKHTPDYFFSQALVRRIVKAIKTPLAEQWINPLKPLISFQFSPERSKADGVTLDLDLHQATDDQSRQQVIEFVKSLKSELSENFANIDVQSSEQIQLRRVAAEPESQVVEADVSDEYYLNMMVPVSTLLRNGEALELAAKNKTKAKNVGFYTLENLAEIAPSVNLFIMVFDPLAVSTLANKAESVDYCDDLTDSSAEVALMKCLRRYLGKPENAEIAGMLHGKMVPLMKIPPAKTEPNPLLDVLEYSNWSYQGAAFWSLPIPDDSATLIGDTYFSSEDKIQLNPILEPWYVLAENVCNQLCPNRWLMRTFMFVLFSAIVIYAVLSIWLYALRQYLQQSYSLVFMLACCFVLMLLFTCDPYWQDRQQLFMFGFMIILAAVLVLKRLRADEQAKYP